MTDMPIGFVMELAMNEQAMNYYSKLDNNIRTSIKQYIQNNSNGHEAKEKINNVINGLSHNNIDFLNK